MALGNVSVERCLASENGLAETAPDGRLLCVDAVLAAAFPRPRVLEPHLDDSWFQVQVSGDLLENQSARVALDGKLLVEVVELVLHQGRAHPSIPAAVFFVVRRLSEGRTVFGRFPAPKL